MVSYALQNYAIEVFKICSLNKKPSPTLNFKFYRAFLQ